MIYNDPDHNMEGLTVQDVYVFLKLVRIDSNVGDTLL